MIVITLLLELLSNLLTGQHHSARSVTCCPSHSVMRCHWVSEHGGRFSMFDFESRLYSANSWPFIKNETTVLFTSHDFREPTMLGVLLPVIVSSIEQGVTAAERSTKGTWRSFSVFANCDTVSAATVVRVVLVAVSSRVGSCTKDLAGSTYNYRVYQEVR